MKNFNVIPLRKVLVAQVVIQNLKSQLQAPGTRLWSFEMDFSGAVLELPVPELDNFPLITFTTSTLVHRFNPTSPLY